MGERSEARERAEERPLPGGGTDDGEALRRAHRAFDAGDFRAARALADGLRGARDAEVAAAARALRARFAFDPAAAIVLLAGLGLLVAIAWIYLR